eukprot:3235491-Pyramimonas_sp.AAC.1
MRTAGASPGRTGPRPRMGLRSEARPKKNRAPPELNAVLMSASWLTHGPSSLLPACVIRNRNPPG